MSKGFLVKKIFFLIITFSCCIFGIQAQANILISKQISAADLVPNVGVAVYDIEKQKLVLGINELSLYTPASLQKIITAVFVLNKLKRGYTATTKIYKNKQGDIFIQFSGDPKFSLKHLKTLLKSFQGQSVGKVCLVDTSYQLPLLSPGWTIAATQLCYGALTTKSSIGGNRLVAYVTAGKIGKPAQIKFKKGQVNYPIINQTVTKKLCYTDPSVGWMDQMQRDNIDMTRKGLVIKGCVPHDFKNFKVCLPIKPDDIDYYLKKAVGQAFDESKVLIKKGIFRACNMPAGAVLISSVESPLLIDMIKDSLKDSDNFVTDSLFKAAVDIDESKFPANWSFAGKVVRKELNHLMGLTFTDKDLKIEDGSGLSMYNRVSAKALSQLLAKMHQKDSGFYKMLPRAGTDGTLTDRLKSVKGKIWAKTGTLNGINTLAGYIVKNGHPKYSFAIMINGPTDQLTRNKNLIDQIVRSLTDSF